MTLPDVQRRGENVINQYPRENALWQFLSKSTCIFVIAASKLFMKCFYKVELENFETLHKSMEEAKRTGRGFVTIMNHSSVVDDPFVWACLPLKMYANLQNIRWCLGAKNICFSNCIYGNFFSLGQVLPTERFGKGPFQDAIDGSIAILNSQWKRHSSWVHIFPEGYVLQLQQPYNNSMRYFRWGVSRMILETDRPPVVLPIFTTGFEKMFTESNDVNIFKNTWKTMGSTAKISVGQPVPDEIIVRYREQWKTLMDKHLKEGETDLNDELKYGKEATDLRSQLAAELREQVAQIREKRKDLQPEDPRFKSVDWWTKYTKTEGASDPDIKFIGVNWAVKRFQPHVNNDDQ
ncbi:lysophosphatidylcholine acyltransferase KNAG_0A07870 [Huiozyma naganishii CBS 8797]|uniref:Tafazzin family protein n=1 Tax=Huiozyma naganishii (strain ATCC MYA-139 / BCRC 22969 / CBS 8797 / KCTC 17520 / NBRC 10181 / NCYC 3082 / Yp74L-3) TaxID=1071383 RepID=J7S308_HUIN7|nr:hypothetical protein KNAG_0A07870 [Kazachstania naganishii CBS 8797]CCK68439.1 hypothetical protein KNAG_0A07870 [Kazachstania naganishii CBS 8797]